jgi:hypothetical protein
MRVNIVWEVDVVITCAGGERSGPVRHLMDEDSTGA